MSRLLAYLGNDPERVQCALHPGRALLVDDAVGADSWGVGFYQGGEVLLRRKPKPPAAPVDFYEVASEVRTDALIGHVRRGTVGAPKDENTPPFRFRSWLFAHHGTVDGFERIRPGLLEEVPDYLRRNLRGETDSEHLFHRFLAELHALGKLDDPLITTTEAGRAIARMIAAIERLCAAAGATPPELDLAVTNGRILLAVRRGAPMHLRRLQGIRDCPVCRERSGPVAESGRGARVRPVDHEHLRAVVLVADSPGSPGPPWQEVAERHLVAVSHALAVTIEPLGAG